jgi:hypothetical protein
VNVVKATCLIYSYLCFQCCLVCENLGILNFMQRSISIAVSSLGSHVRFNAQDICLIIFGIYNPYYQVTPIPVASRSNAWVCGRSIARTGGFESRRDHGSLSLVSVFVVRSLHRSFHSSRGVLPSVASVIVKPHNEGTPAH